VAFRERLRRWRPVLLLAGVALTALNLYLWRTHALEREEQQALLSYFARDNRPLHLQIVSIKRGLGGLVNETAPSAKGAVSIIDENILPSLDLVIEAARRIAPEEEAARDLHREYLAAITAMRADTVRIRAVFARPDADLGEARIAALSIMVESEQRLDAFFARAVEVCRAHGVDLAIDPPAARDAGPPG
jgi:hypothetical protein